MTRARTGPRAAVAIAGTTLIVGAVGYLASQFAESLPELLNSTLFGVGSLFAAALVAAGVQTFNKMDKLLQDAERFHAVRVNQLYAYLGSLRGRLMVWLVAGFCGLLVSGAAAYLLREETWAWKTATVGIGYGAFTLVVLSGIRILSAYLRLDRFRNDVFRAVRKEEERLETLRKLRPKSALREFNAGENPPHVGMLSHG